MAWRAHASVMGVLACQGKEIKKKICEEGKENGRNEKEGERTGEITYPRVSDLLLE